MRRRLPLLRTVIGLGAALLALATVALFVARVDRVVVAAGRLEGGSSPVRAPVDGLVAEVHVGPGERVEAGRPLLTLDTAAREAAHSAALARIARLEEHLAGLAAETRRRSEELHPAEVAQAQREVRSAELVRDSNVKRVELLQRLEGQGLVRRIELEEAELQRQLSEVQLEEAREAHQLLATRHAAALEVLAGQQREAREELAEERAGAAELERLIAASVVRAEAEGLVLAERLDELPGRAVRAGEELFRLAHARADRFAAVVRDSGRSRTRAGAPVRIRLGGYPWLLHGVLRGRVDYVSDRRDASGGFPVRVSVDPEQTPGPLFEGMTGEARIVVEESVTLGRLLLEKLVGPFDP